MKKVDEVLTPREAVEQGLVRVTDRQIRARCRKGFYTDARQLGKEWIISKGEIIEKEK